MLTIAFKYSAVDIMIVKFYHFKFRNYFKEISLRDVVAIGPTNRTVAERNLRYYTCMIGQDTKLALSQDERALLLTRRYGRRRSLLMNPQPRWRLYSTSYYFKTERLTYCTV